MSTDRLIYLEEDNRNLRKSLNSRKFNETFSLAIKPVEKSKNKPSSIESKCADNQRSNDSSGQFSSIDLDDDDDDDCDDSESELTKCLYDVDLLHGLKKKVSKHNKVNTLGGSNSTYSLSSMSTSTANESAFSDHHYKNNKLPSSQSCWQFDGNKQLHSDSKLHRTNHSDRSYCEKCEVLNQELSELKEKFAKTVASLEDVTEKKFVLEKLNRCIEIENENFAYKVCLLMID